MVKMTNKLSLLFYSVLFSGVTWWALTFILNENIRAFDFILMAFVFRIYLTCDSENKVL